MRSERDQATAVGPGEERLRWVTDLSSVRKNDWDALAEPLAYPFLEWDWLRTLELSQSTSAETGWLPHHLTVWRGQRLIAAAPLYVKGHSAGEFVFDHVWADVAGRLQTDYYPKLVGMSPFTPMIGYRFLMAPDADQPRVTGLMIAEIERLCRRNGLSGVSFLFVDPMWRRQMRALGFQEWRHVSFAWVNRGFQEFGDYLAAFNANQRRNIKRERAALRRRGLNLEVFDADRIPPALIPQMYAFYERTNAKFGPWGCHYLTRPFFEMIGERFLRRLVVVAAFAGPDRQSPVAMALLVRKKDRLYGRYWGCAEDFPMLHFNACYYTPIEWAIRNGITRFDPGAGGVHKVRRGFAAVPNYSLHRFWHAPLQQLLIRHIGAINRLEGQQIDELNTQLPFAHRP